MSVASRPLLFLDVDGVLNCLRAEGYDRVHAPARTEAGNAVRSEGIYAMVPPGSRQRIARLLGAFEPVWATAWMGSAHGHFRDHLALSEAAWPWLVWADLKLPHILRYAKGRPWAWVDDDAEWELRQLGPAFRDLPNSCVIAPDPRVGLTDEHADSLLEFAQRYTDVMSG